MSKLAERDKKWLDDGKVQVQPPCLIVELHGYDNKVKMSNYGVHKDADYAMSGFGSKL